MERNSAWSRWCLKIESHVMRGAWRGERRQRTERARRGRRRCVEKGMWHRMGLRPAAGEATVPRSERGRAADGHGTGVGPERDRTGTGLPTDGTAEMCARPGAATGDVRAAWCDSEETRARRRRHRVRLESRARDAGTPPARLRWSEAVRLLPKPEMSPYSFQNNTWHCA